MLTATDNLLWKALADPTRRRMLAALAGRAMTTGELVDSFSTHLVRTAVMKHLDILEAARLLRTRREGRLRWNHLDRRPLERALSWLERHVRTHEDNLERLKALAEGDPNPPKPKPRTKTGL